MHGTVTTAALIRSQKGQQEQQLHHEWLSLGPPLHVVLAEIRVDGCNVDARIFSGLLLDMSNDRGSLGDIVRPANLHQYRDM